MLKLLRTFGIVVIFTCAGLQTTKAQNAELISTSELINLIRSDNLWCFNFKTSCEWIENIDRGGDATMQWWARTTENESQDVTVRSIKIVRIGNLLCDSKIESAPDFTLHYYHSRNYEWKAVNEIDDLIENSPGYVQEARDNHNGQLDCYGYKKRGFSHKGYPQYEQFIYIDGLNGEQSNNSDLLVLIPRLQMHGVTLTP